MKERYVIYLAMIIVLTFLSSVKAETYKLYKDFDFGTLKQDISKIKGVYNCSEDTADNLCLNDQKFLNYSWDIEFIFLNAKLTTINLITDFNNEKYVTILKTLAEDFSLVAIQNKKDGILDLIQLIREVKDTEKYKQKITLFERNGLEAGSVKFFYYEKSAIESVKKDSANVSDLAQKADKNMREIAFEVYEDNEGAWCELTFSFPLMIKEFIKNIPAKKEKF